jgi:hypothetical protein
VSYVLSMHPAVLATLKVCFVLAGHIAGVIAAHDRALWLLPKGHRVTGQLAMMLVMVGYTFTGCTCSSAASIRRRRVVRCRGGCG